MSCDSDFGEYGCEQFSATFLYVEDVCGSWTAPGSCYDSDFGEIGYPLSTVDYEYTGCQYDYCLSEQSSNTYHVDMSCDRDFIVVLNQLFLQYT